MTAEATESALADFRAWLAEWDGLPETEFPDPAADFAAVVSGFTALRHEVNLQTKSARAAVEQTGEAIKLLTERPAAAKSDTPDDAARPFIKVLVGVYDQLELAARGVEKHRLMTAALPRPNALARFFGAKRSAPESSAAADALLAGYHMSLERIDRLLAQHGLEVILAVNLPFNPELMEALDVEQRPDVAPGTVTAELRRGYLWRGQVFRFAQVKVSR